MDVLWLKTDELPHKQTAEIACVSKNQAPRYLRMYNKEALINYLNLTLIEVIDYQS